MIVILLLLLFATLLVIDHFHGKRNPSQPAMPPALAPVDEAAPRLRPHIVAGFQVPENVRYHPGHTWALKESPTLVRIGMDDFAAKLLGPIDGIVFPQRGQWIRQGQRILSIERHGAKIDLVSPIEGSVSEVNDVLAKDAALAGKDPYGDGWLLTVQAPDAPTNFRNLLGGALARSWMQEAAVRLQRRLLQLPKTGNAAIPAGALAQDGGVAVDDLAAQLPEPKFAELAREFFLG
jgi:glycine cleavage system H lipoate-binding protein